MWYLIYENAKLLVHYYLYRITTWECRVPREGRLFWTLVIEMRIGKYIGA